MTNLPMNLPNKITLTRIALIPVYLILMVLDAKWCQWTAAAVFAVAALTDLADGMIARKYGLVTDFGKFMDPIADKLLVLLPYILLVTASDTMADVWAVIIMVAREVTVSGFRLVAARRRIVIAADWSGKLKTVLQMASVLMLTLGLEQGWYVAWAAAALSLYSGIEIIVRNRAVLEEDR